VIARGSARRSGPRCRPDVLSTPRAGRRLPTGCVRVPSRRPTAARARRAMNRPPARQHECAQCCRPAGRRPRLACTRSIPRRVHSTHPSCSSGSLRADSHSRRSRTRLSASASSTQTLIPAESRPRTSSRSITSRAVAIAGYDTADCSVHDPSVKAIAACATRRQSCQMAKRWSRTHPHARPSGFNSCGLDHATRASNRRSTRSTHADRAVSSCAPRRHQHTNRRADARPMRCERGRQRSRPLCRPPRGARSGQGQAQRPPAHSQPPVTRQ
jgi:hypothetical protein